MQGLAVDTNTISSCRPARTARFWASQSRSAPRAHLPSRVMATILMIAIRPMAMSERFHTKFSEAMEPTAVATRIIKRNQVWSLLLPRRKSTLISA